MEETNNNKKSYELVEKIGENENEEVVEDNIIIDNKNGNDKNENDDDFSNPKIIPLEIEHNKEIGEYCVNVDILKDNETPLLTLKEAPTTKTVISAQDEKDIFFHCFKEIPIRSLKIFTIIIILLYIGSGVAGVIFFVKNRDKRPFLFCFNFFSRERNKINSLDVRNYDTIIFSTDLNSFCIIHVILLFLLIMLLITILRKKENDSKNFLKNFSIFFPLSLLFNIPIFITGIFASNGEGEEHVYYSVIHNIFNILSTICIMKIYIGSKKHKFKNLMRVINQGFLPGLLSAFELYSLFYNICYLSTFWKKNIIFNFEIIPGSVYFIFSILILILYNDIFFPVTALIIQIGLLYIKKKESMAIVIFNICVVFFSFLSIILSIMKHKKKVFNIIIEGEGGFKNKKNN